MNVQGRPRSPGVPTSGVPKRSEQLQPASADSDDRIREADGARSSTSGDKESQKDPGGVSSSPTRGLSDSDRPGGERVVFID